jgi:hypothetical protein
MTWKYKEQQGILIHSEVVNESDVSVQKCLNNVYVYFKLLI